MKIADSHYSELLEWEKKRLVWLSNEAGENWTHQYSVHVATDVLAAEEIVQLLHFANRKGVVLVG